VIDCESVSHMSKCYRWVAAVAEHGICHTGFGRTVGMVVWVFDQLGGCQFIHRAVSDSHTTA